MHAVNNQKNGSRNGGVISGSRKSRSIILLLGSMDDLLIRCVATELQVRKVCFASISEDELFSNTLMEYERSGRNINGRLRTGSDNTIPLKDISGVLSRLSRTWWPSGFSDLQDQMFVYHETTAAWYNVLAFLRSPVINRFPLGWWLQDLNFGLTLARQFSTALELSLAPIILSPDYSVRLVPTGPRIEPHLSSIYIAGKALVTRDPRMNRIAEYLRSRQKDLERWQRQSEIRLCRLDFDKNTLVSIEAFPLFEEESENITRQIASAVADLLL